MRFAPATAQERIAARHIPAGSTEERHDEADVVVYHHLGKHGEVYAIGYAGKAYRPAFNFRFKDETRRAAYVAEWVKSHRARVEQRQVHKAEKKEARHELQLGDVVYSSWGYDQTNVDFYQVVRVVSAKTVEVRRLQQETTETGFMSGSTTARKDQFTDGVPVLVKRAEELRVLNIGSSRGSAAKWDGRPLSCSWYC